MFRNAADRRLFGRAVLDGGLDPASSLCLGEGRSLPPSTSARRPVLPLSLEVYS
jgi:hypothetical protein